MKVEDCSAVTRFALEASQRRPNATPKVLLLSVLPFILPTSHARPIDSTEGGIPYLTIHETMWAEVWWSCRSIQEPRCCFDRKATPKRQHSELYGRNGLAMSSFLVNHTLVQFHPGKVDSCIPPTWIHILYGVVVVGYPSRNCGSAITATTCPTNSSAKPALHEQALLASV